MLRRKGGERTDVRHDTSHDDLPFSCSTDSFTELGIVPGVHFALTLDQRSVGIHVGDQLWERAVRAWYRLIPIIAPPSGGGQTLLSRSGHDDRDIKQLPQRRMSDHIVMIQGCIEVASELIEADLKVEDQEDLSAAQLGSWTCVVEPTESFWLSLSHGTAEDWSASFVSCWARRCTVC